MEYAQLNEAGTEALQVTTNGPIEWDENNYCTAAALVKDGKAEEFRVVELIETQPPEIDTATQTVYRDGCEMVDGRWQYKWTVRDLTPEEIEAGYKASIPQVVTIRQAKLALLQAELLDNIETAMTQADRATQIEWEYATEFRRDWPALITMQQMLGLTDKQIDELFRLALTL